MNTDRILKLEKDVKKLNATVKKLERKVDSLHNVLWHRIETRG